MESNPFVKIRGLSKNFGVTKALKQVDLNIYSGEVMALIGENGAGKSTVIKCISGIHKFDIGQMWINNEKIVLKSVNDAKRHGISVVHQELKLAKDLTVAENIFLGQELRTSWGFLDLRQMNKRAKELMLKIGITINPKTKVSSLKIGQQQMVEIAKALNYQSKIILFDEPTDALTKVEVDDLFKIIKKLKKQNVAMLYISHRLEEINQIAEKVTIFRDGESIIQKDTKKITINQIINHMIGRELVDYYPPKFKMKKDLVLSVKNLNGQFSKNVSFDVYKGEILGFSGLMGAGRTELMETIIGYTPKKSGSIYLNDSLVNIQHPADAIKNKIYYMTEDRKEKGLFLDWSIAKNITISNLKGILQHKIISHKKEIQIAKGESKKIRVKLVSVKQAISNLSGGNQQKVALAKALFVQPDVFIIDEPTRGIDVGSKKEIYDILFELKRRGIAIIVITSDLPELFGISDKIIVMSQGKITGSLDTLASTENDVMKLAI